MSLYFQIALSMFMCLTWIFILETARVIAYSCTVSDVSVRVLNCLVGLLFYGHGNRVVDLIDGLLLCIGVLSWCLVFSCHGVLSLCLVLSSLFTVPYLLF